MRVTSATQSLDAVQQAVSTVLGLPFNKVAVGEHIAALVQHLVLYQHICVVCRTLAYSVAVFVTSPTTYNALCAAACAA
jgi:multisubunit Na+/H+ antiporter MnhG subunit